MPKNNYSFKLEQNQIETLTSGARQYGMNKSQYLRSIIDAQQRVQLNSEDKDLVVQTKNARNALFSEITLAVIKALAREFDPFKTTNPVTTIRKFVKKHEFSSQIVSEVLNQLVIYKILERTTSNSGKTKYLWTYLGIAAFPEYAPLTSDANNLVSGSILSALSGMLGDYDDVVNHIFTKLKIDKNVADSLLRFLIQNYLGYFVYLREIAFPLTGVNDPIDPNYYRNQMLDYLLVLIPNYGYKWQDWKTNEALNLKAIVIKILEYKNAIINSAQ